MAPTRAKGVYSTTQCITSPDRYDTLAAATSAPDLIEARESRFLRDENERPEYGKLQARMKKLQERKEERAKGRPRSQGRTASVPSSPSARGVPGYTGHKPRYGNDEPTAWQKRRPKTAGPARAQVAQSPYWRDDRNTRGWQDVIDHYATQHERYKEPYPAGVGSELSHPGTRQTHVPESDLRGQSMTKDLGDGFQRPKPGECDVLKKAVVHYAGHVPQWTTHHGVGENFTRRREACLKKTIVKPDLNDRDTAGGEAQRLLDIERTHHKGPELYEGARRKPREPDKNDFGTTSQLPGTPWGQFNRQMEGSSVEPHIRHFERKVAYQ